MNSFNKGLDSAPGNPGDDAGRSPLDAASTDDRANAEQRTQDAINRAVLFASRLMRVAAAGEPTLGGMAAEDFVSLAIEKVLCGVRNCGESLEAQLIFAVRSLINHARRAQRTAQLVEEGQGMAGGLTPYELADRSDRKKRFYAELESILADDPDALAVALAYRDAPCSFEPRELAKYFEWEVQRVYNALRRMRRKLPRRICNLIR